MRGSSSSPYSTQARPDIPIATEQALELLASERLPNMDLFNIAP